MTYPKEITDRVDNERAVLAEEKYREVLQKMLAGNPVSGRDAKVVARALVHIAVDLQWPAKRYAHMRQTYVVEQVNQATRQLLKLGVPLHPTDGTVWAKDAGFGWPSYIDEGPHDPQEADRERF